MIILIPWILCSYFVGVAGRRRKIGFTNAFLNSIFLSPIIGLLFLLASKELTEVELAKPRILQLSAKGVSLLRKEYFEEALLEFKAALSLDKSDPIINYNLAVTYSNLKNIGEAYFYLAKAVENGYSNFEKIKAAPQLMFLRDDPGFSQFIASGYKFSFSPTSTALTNFSNLDALEKLASLKEKGLLTDEEYLKEKIRILK